MPRELIAERPGQCSLREFQELPLKPNQVRVRSLYSAFKHGTEFRAFQANTKDASNSFDSELRLHLRGQERRDYYPMQLGNMYVSEITEVGSGVLGFEPGDQVFGHGKVCDVQALTQGNFAKLPDGMSWQAIMYSDPAGVALAGVRDAHIRLGDRVAVFGLGAIGLMTVQLAYLAGARWVAAIDPIEKRRTVAERHGVDLVLDPTQTDVGVEIKLATGKLGVDVSMETSGAAPALNDALRATRFRGTVASTAFYNAPMAGLNMAGEWHRNRINILSVRSNSEPWADYGWDCKRGDEEAFHLLLQGRLQTDSLIDPIIAFDDVAEAYMQMNSNPEKGIKLGVDHSL